MAFASLFVHCTEPPRARTTGRFSGSPTKTKVMLGQTVPEEKTSEGPFFSTVPGVPNLGWFNCGAEKRSVHRQKEAGIFQDQPQILG